MLAPSNKANDIVYPLFPETGPDLEIVGLTGHLGAPDVGQFHFHRGV